MEALRALFTKPDPQAQSRKCNAIIREDMRKLDRSIRTAAQVEAKAMSLIQSANKRAQSNSGRAADTARKEARDFAKELLLARRASARLAASKATLESVRLQVHEAFAMRRLEGSIRISVGVMRDVNQLIRLPEMAATMQQLSMELVKAGVVDEMVGEMLPEDDDLFGYDEEEDAEGEVDRVLDEVLKGRATNGRQPAGRAPTRPAAAEPVPVNAAAVAHTEDEEEEEDAEAMMNQMRSRLEALRS